jgi:hypothetical protein
LLTEGAIDGAVIALFFMTGSAGDPGAGAGAGAPDVALADAEAETAVVEVVLGTFSLIFPALVEYCGRANGSGRSAISFAKAACMCAISITGYVLGEIVAYAKLLSIFPDLSVVCVELQRIVEDGFNILCKFRCVVVILVSFKLPLCDIVNWDLILHPRRKGPYKNILERHWISDLLVVCWPQLLAR